MPSHLAADLGRLESRADVHAKEEKEPVTGAPPFWRGWRNPITVGRVSGLPSPHQQNSRQLRIEWNGLLRCLRLAGSDALKSDGAGNLQLEIFEVRPFQREQFTYPQSSENVEEHGGLVRLLETFEQ